MINLLFLAATVKLNKQDDGIRIISKGSKTINGTPELGSRRGENMLYHWTHKWSFTVLNKLGYIIKQIPLRIPNLPFTYQTLLNENILQPGWINNPTFSPFLFQPTTSRIPVPKHYPKLWTEQM